jgi:hypothetical protein
MSRYLDPDRKIKLEYASKSPGNYISLDCSRPCCGILMLIFGKAFELRNDYATLIENIPTNSYVRVLPNAKQNRLIIEVCP